MKILLPYVSLQGNRLDSPIVLGGIERFQQLLYQNIPGIIPVPIPKDERLAKDASTIIRDWVEKYQPDVILTNAANTSLSNGILKYGIKMIHIHHEPLERTMMLIGTCEGLLKMIDGGVDVYFVSQNQYDFYDENCNRLLKRSIGNIKGFVNPSFADENAKPDEEVIYNLSTIGRNIASKDPFWVHKRLHKSGLSSLVLTSKPQKYKSDEHNEYVGKNANWQAPQHTQYGLTHNENMKYVAKSGSFASTWPLESWGITALESLSHGIPTILLTDSSDKHASEAIAADSSHVLKIRKSDKDEAVVKAVNEFNELSHADRIAISDATKKKHNKEIWIKTITDMFKDVETGKGYKPKAWSDTNLFSFGN
jgi:hypothetical protein